MTDLKIIAARFKKAEAARKPVEDRIREAMWYTNRTSFDLYGMNENTDEFFDPIDVTASMAVKQKVDEVQALMFPYNLPFIKLKKQKWHATYTQKLEDAEDKFHAAIRHSNFFQELKLALTDSMISNGNLIIARSQNPESPLQFRHVPLYSAYHAESEGCELTCSFVRNNLNRKEAVDMFGVWGDLNLEAVFGAGSEQNPEADKKTIIECYEKNKAGLTDYSVFAGGDGNAPQMILQRLGLPDLCFIAFRYGRIGGSVVGYGNVLMALGLIRVVNQVQALSLENQERALGGNIAFDHDIINADDFNRGGNLRTINVPDGVNYPQMIQSSVPFENSLFILDRMREQVRDIIFGTDLPRPDSGVRSATEYNLRNRRHFDSYLPDTDNLRRELFDPLIEFGLRILSNKALSASPYYLSDEGMYENGVKQFDYTPENSIALQASKEQAASYANAVATVLQLFPNHAPAVIKVHGVIRKMLIYGGVDEKELFTEKEAAQRSQQVEESVQAAQAQGGSIQPSSVSPFTTDSGGG